MENSKAVIFLKIWFFWAMGRDVYGLVRYPDVSDFHVLSNADVAWLYFAMALAVCLLNIASVYYVFRPRPVGPRILYGALAAGVMQNVVTLAFSLKDLSGVREIYVRSRQNRGLSVDQEMLDMLFTPQGMLVLFAAMLCLYGLIALAVYRNKAYFQMKFSEVAKT